MSLKIKETVNAIVLEQLEKGVVARRKTRNSIQVSGATGKPYGGINQLVLQIQKMKYQYSNNCRLTFRLVNQVGGSVKKGEKGTPAVYFKMLEVPDAET